MTPTLTDMLKQCCLCDRANLLHFRLGAYYCDECLERHPDILSVESVKLKPFIPDAKACIHLYPTENGGRCGPIITLQLGCPIKIEGTDDGSHDCRILIKTTKGINPGQTFTAPMAFLRPDLVAPWLQVGMKFKLLGGQPYIGEGEILEVYYKSNYS